jgi:hypothetical protein
MESAMTGNGMYPGANYFNFISGEATAWQVAINDGD